MPRNRRSLVLTVALTVVLGLTPSLFAPGARAVVVPTAAAVLPATVTADALPTVQINGVVWKQVIVGNTVYAGGEFTNARPAGAAPGVSTVPRSNLLAYDIRTGVLVNGFAPVVNGRVKDLAVTPDGTKLIAAGNFTQVDGKTRSRVAVFNLTATTATLSDTVVPSLNGEANTVAATNSTIYLGGWFGAVNGTARIRIGAVRTTNGSLVTGFSVPVDDRSVQSIVVSPDESSVVLGGNFTSVGGSTNPGYGLARVNAATGVMQPLPLNSVIRNGGAGAGIMRLATDGTSFYGVGWVYGSGGNSEGTFQASWSDGNLVTLEDCHGDTYDVAPVGDVVYTASHKHYCGNSGGFPQTNPWTAWHSTAWTKSVQGVNTRDIYGYPDHPGTPRPGLLPWFPKTTPGTYTGTSQATWAVTGNSQYVLYGGEFTYVNDARQQGIVRYAVRSIAPKKDGPRPTSVGFTQPGGPVGSYTFAPTVQSLAAGTTRVNWPALWDRDDGTLRYQVFRDSTATKVFEATQTNFQWNGQVMQFNDTGLTPGASVRYLIRVLDADGNLINSSWVSTTVTSSNPLGTYGNKVLSDGATKYWRLDEPSGNGVADRAGTDNTTAGSGVSRGTAGALSNSTNTASTFNGTTSGVAISRQVVPGPDTFSQEVWFRTTSSLGGRIAGFGDRSSGNSSNYDRHIYMDTQGRVLFGVHNGTATAIQSATGLNNGQWHQAVATLGPAGMALYVDGRLVANRADVVSGLPYNGYWRVGGDNTWSGARYFNGSIDEYAVFPTALTPVQVDGHWVASGRTSTGPVTPNTRPTAAFTSSTSGLTASFNASTSTDTDGTVASYAWTFGDGTTGTGVSPGHAYASAGTYPVSLTVTDDKGATSDPVSHDVTVTAPVPGVLASDTFQRTVTAGWGTAPVGGTWTVGGGATRASVDAGVARFVMPAASTMTADLTSVSSQSSRVTAEFSVDKVYQGTAEGAYVAVVGRQVGVDKYLGRLVIEPSGAVRLYLLRNFNALAAVYTVPGLTVVPNERYKLSVQVTGVSPTTVAAKVWKASDPEPATWQRTGTDSLAALQAPGSIGTFAYLPGATTNAPITTSYYSFQATVN